MEIKKKPELTKLCQVVGAPRFLAKCVYISGISTQTVQKCMAGDRQDFMRTQHPLLVAFKGTARKGERAGKGCEIGDSGIIKFSEVSLLRQTCFKQLEDRDALLFSSNGPAAKLKSPALRGSASSHEQKEDKNKCPARFAKDEKKKPLVNYSPVN